MLTVDLQFKLGSIDDLAKFAQVLAPCLRNQDVVCLTGDLGAGKTTFTRFLVKELGFTDFVSSPTFNILHEYSVRQDNYLPNNEIDIVYHFDTYRLETAENFQASALDNYFGEGLCLVEWGELIATILPRDTIYLAISYEQNLQTNTDDSERIIKLTVPQDLTLSKPDQWQRLFDFCLKHTERV